MSRRIDVELTSDRGDGSWSWRAAGARQPKGVLDAGLLYEGAQVGDVVRAEADFDIDGITVTSVQAPKGARREPERIEIRGAEKEFTPITSSLTGKARERAERGEDDRPRRSRDDRSPRPGGPGGPGGRPGGRPGGPPRGEGDRGPRPGGERRAGDRPQRPPRPAPPAPKPKAKKLRPQRVHREALLASLSPEQQPIAEQLLRGGMPAVRAAVEEQNAKAKAEDGLEVPVDTVLGIAEQLVTRTRVADWLDRAEAAKATGEELALRDLRSVVSTADDVAREESTRELAAELKAMLEQRTESEQRGWLTDIEGSLAGGRVVRALRLSSRPPEPGNTFPAELTARLTEAANGALTTEIASDRWATVLDAVAYSPVRRAVVPAGIPAEPTEELLVAVRKHAGRTPAIATLFGVEPPPDKASKAAKRPAKAAGRNPNLSRAGGPRGGTAVPVPGRAGGPPVPPAKRIPPPPGRQIGATLPGSPPVATPRAQARPAADPTAPLTPPSATGAAEPEASLGTPAATPADLDPTDTPVAPESAAEQADGVSEPDAGSTGAATGTATPGTGAPAPEGEPDGAGTAPPEGEAALDAALTLTEAPAAEATPVIAAAAYDAPPVNGETTSVAGAPAEHSGAPSASGESAAPPAPAEQSGAAPASGQTTSAAAAPAEQPDASSTSGDTSPPAADEERTDTASETGGSASAASAEQPEASDPAAEVSLPTTAPVGDAGDGALGADVELPSGAAPEVEVALNAAVTVAEAPAIASTAVVAAVAYDAPPDDGDVTPGESPPADEPPPADEAPPDAALTLIAGPGPEATGVVPDAAFEATSDPGGSSPAPAAPPSPDEDHPVTTPPAETPDTPAAEGELPAATSPEAEVALDATLSLTDGPGPEATAVVAAAAFDSPPADGPDAEPPSMGDVPVDPLVATSSGTDADVLASGPSDSSLPDPAVTGEEDGPPAAGQTEQAAEQVADLDAVVSQAAAGPFEPPADPPVEDAPNSGVGSAGAENEGSAPAEEPETP